MAAPKVTMSLRSPRAIAANTVSAMTLRADALWANAVNSNFVPDLTDTWKSISVLSLPVGRVLNYRGLVTLEITSTQNIARTAGQAVSFRVLASDGSVSSSNTITFTTFGATQWFCTRLIFTDLTIGTGITSLTVQMNAFSSADVTPLVIRSISQLLPTVMKQPI